MREMKVDAACREYIKALNFVEMYHSPACWRTVDDVHREFNKLGSETARREAVKEQIRIRVIGQGWKDLHVPWSCDGVTFTSEQLRDELIDKIIPAQSTREIRKVPPVNLPSRGERQHMGTKSLDLEKMDSKKAKKEKQFRERAEKKREEWEADGKTDNYENLQPSKPKVDNDLINTRIEQRFDYDEPDGSVVPMWCRGVVVAVMKNSKVHIEWEEKFLRDGDPPVTKERLLTTKWNKNVNEGWRCIV